MTAPPRHIERIDGDGNGRGGFGDLVRQLGNDAKRLVGDEVRLAKAEVKENVHNAARAGMWLGLAAGVGVICVVALTILLTTVIGAVTGDRYWLGALLTGLLELVGAWLLIKGGLAKFKEPSYTLEATREELARTASWAKRETTEIPRAVNGHLQAEIRGLVH